MDPLVSHLIQLVSTAGGLGVLRWFAGRVLVLLEKRLKEQHAQTTARLRRIRREVRRSCRYPSTPHLAEDTCREKEEGRREEGGAS